MWQGILTLISVIIPQIPSLVTVMENLFSNKKQSGLQKAAGVINAVAPLIAQEAGNIAKLAPAGTDAAKIATAVEAYTKAVNDATVVLANDLGIFPHTTPTPAA
jgi:hypothetical protein